MIDARGLSCPLPVLQVKKAVETKHPDTLTVLVDNETAVQNVTRYASNVGYSVTRETLDEDEYSLTLNKA